MIKLRTPTAKIFGALLVYLPFRFVVYFLAIKLGLPHGNLIELASELLVGLAGLYLIATNFSSVWAKLKQPRRWPLLIKLAAVLMAWSFVALSYTPAGFAQAVRGLRLDMLGLVILIILWLVPIEESEQPVIYDLAYWACVAVAVVGIYELLFGPGLFHTLGFAPYQFLAGKIRQVHSLVPSPNMFGSTMVVLAALLFRRYKYKPAWWTAAILGILAGSSYSRSAWLAFALLGSCILIYQLRRGVVAWAVGFMAVGLALGIFMGIVRYHGSFSTAATHDNSTSQHQAAFHQAEKGLTTFSEEWFIGDGIGSSGPATFNSNQPTRVSESWFIQLFQELGMLGVVLYLAVIIVLVRQLLQLHEPIMAFLAVALSANALFLHIWADDRFVHMVFWILMGATLFTLPSDKARAKA